MANISSVIFRQLLESTTMTYTYLVACARSREALLIDPVLEMVNRDLQLVDELGLKLKYVINTHVHADHVTGSGEIKKRLNKPGEPLAVQSILGKASGGKANIYVEDGTEVLFGEGGRFKLRCLSTPGHTNGCTSLICDALRCVFTGDALFVRGCGRTDFQQGDPSLLFNSVREKLFKLPDDYYVYPGHDYNGHQRSTIGEEKQFNPRLKLTNTREQFVDIMVNLKLAYPKQIDRAVPLNLVCGLPDDTKE